MQGSVLIRRLVELKIKLMVPCACTAADSSNTNLFSKVRYILLYCTTVKRD